MSIAHWALEALWLAFVIFMLETSLLNTAFSVWECRLYPDGRRYCTHVVVPPDLGF